MTSPGYLELFWRRPAYRSLLLGAVVSLCGDWFTLIALYGLLHEYTGSGEAAGLMLAARFVPYALLGPVAGVVADRLPRKAILVTADLTRAVVVLGFLWVRGPGDVWLVYVLTALSTMAAAFFDPAEQAAVAGTVAPEELITANTLHGMVWSAMLSLGALAGGAVTALAGRELAFAVNACTYLGSAAFILRAALPRPAHVAAPASLASFFADAGEVLGRLRRDGPLRQALFVKTGWSLPGGAALLLYAVLGERVFPVAGRGSFGVSALLAARGLGALVGPVVARRLGTDTAPFLQTAIASSFLVVAAGWLGVAASPSLALACLCLFVAHLGVSVQWVFSTALINLTVEDRLRGRVFALEGMAATAALGLSSWLGGLVLDRSSLGPRGAVGALSLLMLVSGLVWWALGPPATTGRAARPSGSAPGTG